MNKTKPVNYQTPAFLVIQGANLPGFLNLIQVYLLVPAFTFHLILPPANLIDCYIWIKNLRDFS